MDSYIMTKKLQQLLSHMNQKQTEGLTFNFLFSNKISCYFHTCVYYHFCSCFLKELHQTGEQNFSLP